MGITATVSQDPDTERWTYHAVGEGTDFTPDETFHDWQHASQDAEIRFAQYGITIEVDAAD